MVVLLMEESSPDVGHFQGLKLTECTRSSISSLEFHLWDKALMCLLWSSPLWSVQLCLEDPFTLISLFLHSLAKQGGQNDLVSHSYWRTCGLGLDAFLAF